MPERITKIQRWLDLIALLMGRKIPLEVEEIMERVPAYASRWREGTKSRRQSTRRMFERDKDELRAMGIPLETVHYSINFGADHIEGYRLSHKDFYLPYLRIVGNAPSPLTHRSLELQPGEAETLLEAARKVDAMPELPIAADARSAISKLTFDLDPDHFPGAPIHRVVRPGTKELLERLDVLVNSLLTRKSVHFRYHGIVRGTPTERHIDPYGLFLQGDWYLVGYDHSREAVRVFRVGRIEGITLNPNAPKTPDYDVPADFQLTEFVGRPAWRLDDEPPVAVEVRFRFPTSLLVAQREQGESVSTAPDGGSVRRFLVSDPNPFIRWVLGFAGDAAIISPPELRSRFLATAEAVRASNQRFDA